MEVVLDEIFVAARNLGAYPFKGSQIAKYIVFSNFDTLRQSAHALRESMKPPPAVEEFESKQQQLKDRASGDEMTTQEFQQALAELRRDKKYAAALREWEAGNAERVRTLQTTSEELDLLILPWEQYLACDMPEQVVRAVRPFVEAPPCAAAEEVDGCQA